MKTCRLSVLSRALFPVHPRHYRSFSVGENAEIRRIFTEDDIGTFVRLTGDNNPLHLDVEFARSHHYEACIVHGALVNGLVSAVLGTKLPGPGCVVVSQNIQYTAPLFVNEEVSAAIRIEDVTRKIVTASYMCTAVNRNKVVLKGDAKLYIPLLQSSK